MPHVQLYVTEEQNKILEAFQVELKLRSKTDAAVKIFEKGLNTLQSEKGNKK